MAIDRITYRGTHAWANDAVLRRVSAVGSTSNIAKEEVREMGNKGIVEYVDNTPSVDLSIDANQYGSMRTLLALAGKNPFVIYKDKGAIVNFSTDLDKDSAKTDMWINVLDDEDVTNHFATYVKDAYLTSVSYQFGVDGNFTERYGLTSDNKVWYLNDSSTIFTATGTGATNAAEITATFDAKAVLYTGGLLTAKRYNADGTVSTVTVNQTGNAFKYTTGGTWNENDKLVVRHRGKLVNNKTLAGAVLDTPTATNDGSTKGALQKGAIKVYLYKKKDNSSNAIDFPVVASDNDADNNISQYDKVELLGVQTLGIDVTVGRDELFDITKTRAYARPLQLPLGVDISIDLTQRDLDLFMQLVGNDSLADENALKDTEVNIDNLVNYIGLYVELYDRRDVDAGTAKVLKRFKVSAMVPRDENWQLSLDGSASQTFSFTAHELVVCGINSSEASA